MMSKALNLRMVAKRRRKPKAQSLVDAMRDLQDLAATAMFEPDVYRGMCDDAQDVNAKLS